MNLQKKPYFFFSQNGLKNFEKKEKIRDKLVQDMKNKEKLKKFYHLRPGKGEKTIIYFL